MPFSVTGLDQALDGLNGGTLSSIIAYASLHSAYSATGSNELSGGSYARVGVTWSAAAGGTKASASIASPLNVPGGSTVAFAGLWSAVSSGTFAAMAANGGATQYGFTCTNASPGVLTAPGSSYGNGQTVVLWDSAGAVIPAAFTVGTIYYVVSASGSAFSLAATSGGSAINTSGAGAGVAQAITVETYGAAGTFTISSDTLTLI
jgi:hypothetical protein